MRQRLRLGVLIAALAVPAAVIAQNYIAFEQITVADSAIGFTAATINQGNGHVQANKASCRLETAAIRFRIDGTAPTASVGTPLEVGDVLNLDNPVAMTQFLAIRSATDSGVLNCTYTER